MVITQTSHYLLGAGADLVSKDVARVDHVTGGSALPTMTRRYSIVEYYVL